jgi:hypothetical protein
MNDRTSGDEEWKTRLLRAEARRALAEADLSELLAELVGQVPLEDLEDVLNVPREDLSARAARGREAGPVPVGQLGRDPYEIAQRHLVGEITHEQMIDALRRWRYAPAHRMLDLGDDIGVPTEGSFGATVGRAYDDGLISGEDYDRLLVVRDEGAGPQ